MPAITPMNLARFDLNLLHVLHTVLEERSATRAAKRLHVTQSAVSNALGRLRQAFGDPLVVRNARGLVATPRALQLQPMIAVALRQLEVAVSIGPAFDPRTTTQRFTLACTDADVTALLPRVLEMFAQRMPKASLHITTIEYAVTSGGLARGDVDVVLGLTASVPPGCRSVPLYEDDIVSIVRRDHPTIGDRLTPDEYFSVPHIAIALFGRQNSEVSRWLDGVFAEYGRRPSVALFVPTFGLAAFATSRTDFIGGMSRRAAEAYAKLLPIRIVEHPLAFPKINISLVWHERTDADPGMICFREVLAEASAETDARSSRVTAKANGKKAARAKRAK